MFHPGDLQSGIARALQELKSVICFVTDDSQEAGVWEEWLHDESLEVVVQQKSVALKLKAGSQEAGFLSAFCPIPQVPTLVVVYQGQTVAQIESGISKEDFIQRLSHVISGDASTSSAEKGQEPPTTQLLASTLPENASTSADSTTTTNLEHGQSGTYEPESASAQTTVAAPSTSQTLAASSSPPANVQSLLEERRQRLEADHAARRAEEKAAKAARAKARQEEAQVKAARSQTSIGRDRSYEAEQAKRKREAKEDRERILKQIENDKIARKEREERRRAAARAEQEPGLAEEPQASTVAASGGPSSVSSATSCALQIRLLDGGTIRTSFDPSATLGSQVRTWVSSERPEMRTPYMLKVMQAPQPPRPLSDSDEGSTLRELGLLPSATLIMIPAKGTVSSAYPGTADGAGFLVRLYSLIMGFLIWALQSLQALLAGTGTLARGEPRINASDNASTQPDSAPSTKINPLATDGAADGRTTSAASTTGGTSKIRIRTLRDQNENKENREFYNGNQLSFEPRKDDGDADDKSGVS